MIYELAKQLKDAGFPQTGIHSPLTYHRGEGEPYEPYLDELIEAIDSGVLLWGCKAHGYYASEQFCPSVHSINNTIEAQTEGDTPAITVAKLWLALNKKDEN